MLSFEVFAGGNDFAMRSVNKSQRSRSIAKVGVGGFVHRVANKRTLLKQKN